MCLLFIQNEHVYHAWHLFWTLLNFYTLKKKFETIPFPERFSQLTEVLLPPPPPGSVLPQKIPFTIRDLQDEGFTIEPTDHVTEHLILSDKTVKIFSLTVNDASDLLSYDDNKAAAWAQYFHKHISFSDLCPVPSA